MNREAFTNPFKKSTMSASKKIAVSLFAVSVCLSGWSQTTSKPAAATTASTAKPAVKKAVPVVALKTQQDSLSYAIGLSVANFYKQQDITNINTALVTRAINDALKKHTLLLDEEQANKCIVNYMQKARADKSAGNKKLGEDFLAANKNKPGVVTLPSGLQYLVMKEGTGPKPSATDKVKCHYHGTLIDGKVFDSSVERGEPIELEVNHVIPGWTEALQLMSVGSKWKLFIPSNLAYGDQAAGSIPAGSTLVFEVELLDIVKQ
jgi:FKBP-type peptidyl-prolyl cis-trans isomerase FklB